MSAVNNRNDDVQQMEMPVSPFSQVTKRDQFLAKKECDERTDCDAKSGKF